MIDGIIDCECGAGAAVLGDILPHMDEAWRERFRRTAFALPSRGMHPGGGALTPGAVVPDAAATSAALPATVATAVLVPHQVFPVVGWCDTRLCSVYAAALNAYLVEQWLPRDPRFRLALAVSVHEPELASEDIARHAGDPRIVGVSLSLLSMNMGHRQYRPILEAAARHGLAVIVHPGGQEGNIPGTPTLGGIGPRHPGEYHALIGQVAAANMASLIYDGVFVEFPDLKVVFAGFGLDWVVPVMWHADMEWRNLRVDIPWVVHPPSNYMERNIRVMFNDSEGIPAAALHHLVSVMPESMLLYGSNTPFQQATPDTVLAMLPDPLRARIASCNGAATFARLERK